MKPLLITLVQSTTWDVVQIIILLLVAAAIGYFTAWSYAKSVYTPVVKSLEADKLNLENKADGLKADVSKLENKIEKLTDKVRKLEEEIGEKEKEIKSLKKAKKKSYKASDHLNKIILRR